MDTTHTPTAESSRHSHVGSKGDLRVELRYADVHDGEGRQACLFIYAFNRPKDGVYVPFGSMWQYAERGALDKVVKPLAARIYSFVTKQDEYRVLDAIMDYLEDLKNHKPEPGQDKSLDQFLAECDEADTPFFLEVGGVRVIG